MSAPYNYGFCQEDERTEAKALGLPGGRILSIASGGDMPLSLLALGATEVVAVDAHLGQVRLAELKLAAVLALEQDEALRFLGFLPATPTERRAWLERAMAQLPAESRTYWMDQMPAVLGGAIWAGRYERYLRLLQAILRPFAGRASRDLCACESLQAQADLFIHRFDGFLLRALFQIAFTPRVYVGRGIDPQGLQHVSATPPPGKEFYAGFRALCVGTPARENPWLHLHLLGHLRDAAAAPAYLTKGGINVVRARKDAIAFIHMPVTPYLAAAPSGHFDRFHLSNLPDWMDEAGFEEILELIARKAARPSKLVWRYLHRPVTSSRQAAIQADYAFGEALRNQDRFPLYNLVTAGVEL